MMIIVTITLWCIASIARIASIAMGLVLAYKVLKQADITATCLIGSRCDYLWVIQKFSINYLRVILIIMSRSIIISIIW